MSGRCYSDTKDIKHFKASRDGGVSELRGEHRFVEVRYDRTPEGLDLRDDYDRRPVDEICTTQTHLEMMDEDACWMSICGLHVWIRAIRVKGQRKLRLVVTCFPSGCTPYVVKPGEGTLEGREHRGTS